MSLAEGIREIEESAVKRANYAGDPNKRAAAQLPLAWLTPVVADAHKGSVELVTEIFVALCGSL